MKRKVLFISHDATRTGAPMVLLHLLRWLRSHSDIPFQILLKDGGEMEQEFRAIGPTQVLNWSNPYSDLASKQSFLKQLAQEDFALVYSNTIANGQLLPWLSEIDGPILTHVHELEYRIRHQSAVETVQGTFGLTDRYIAASEAVRMNLVANHQVPVDRVDLIHEFIPALATDTPRLQAGVERMKRLLNIPGDSLVVGSAGTTDWRKGPDLFVQLARSVTSRLPGKQVHFLWVGGESEGPVLAALLYDAQKAGVGSVVRFEGTQSEPLDYFACFDVFVSVSREDPFPLVNLEAAALAKPVVCFEGSGGGMEFVGDDAGFVIDYLDVESMAVRVAQLLRDESQRRRLGARAQRKVSEMCDVSVACPRVLDLIRRAIEEWERLPKNARLAHRRALHPERPASGSAGIPDLFNALACDSLDPSGKALLMRELAAALDRVMFFRTVYNLASVFSAEGQEDKALSLFQLVTRFSQSANPELAGKAFFKLGQLSGEAATARDYYERCLRLCPAHQSARAGLERLTDDTECAPASAATCAP